MTIVDWMMAVLRFAAVASVCPRIVPREEWGANLPTTVVEMQNPVSTVVIHHTSSPAYCATNEACVRAMKGMQEFHQQSRGWDDIGYSFAIGGDGRVYKGRGWNRVGAHSPPYNADSIGITLIGDWSSEAPPQLMLDMAQWLIRCGVDTGRIAPDYQIIGHRQARNTQCPGDGLYSVLQTWDRWASDPKPPVHTVSRPMDAVRVAATPEPPTRDAAAGLYDPSTPDAERDAVEVRPLSKRSLWDRLVTIWQKEAMRQAAVARQEEAAMAQAAS